MGERILLFLNSFNSPRLSPIISIVTFLCDYPAAIAVILVLLWSVDKNKGSALYFVVIQTAFCVEIVRYFARVARPFDVINGLRVSHRETALGWSFPSGHVANGVAIWHSVYRFRQLPHFRIWYISLSILCALTRLVCGANWLTDVLAGFAIGIVLSLFFMPQAEKFDRAFRSSMPLSVTLSSLLMVASLVLYAISGGDPRPEVSSLIIFLSLSSGYVLARFFDEQFLRYETHARLAKHFARYFIGLGTTYLVWSLFALFPTFWRVVAPFVTIVWAAFLYPFVGYYLHIFSSSYRTYIKKSAHLALSD